MHEGYEGLGLAGNSRPVYKNAAGGYKKLRKYVFPAVILTLVIISAISGRSKPAVHDFAGALAMIAGGGSITWKTFVNVVRTRRLTAGVMVFLALVGTAYVGEYLAGAIVAFMMIAGELLEDITLEKTRGAVKELVKLVPDTVRIKKAEGYEEIPTGRVKINDIVVVRPGERIPVDGIIEKGQAAINEASLTGESMPADKMAGDRVYVGTLNENGALEIRTLKLGLDTVLGKMIRVVRQAQEIKGKTQRIADKFAEYFTPAILLICVAVWFVFAGIPFNDRLLRVMTVLVIACPCALVLATPTAVVATVGGAAKKGILIKGGAVLEKAAEITAVCLDKTGTITEGKPEVVEITAFNGYSEKDVILNAAIAEKNSQHPIAGAILNKFKEYGGISIPESEDFCMIPGRGLKVVYEGEVIQVVNSGHINKTDIKDSEAVTEYLRGQEEKGRTAFVVLRQDMAIGGVAVADTVRAGAAEFIEMLKRINIKRIIMLTGDNKRTAGAIAAQVGISEVMVGLLPEDKLNIIKRLQAEGEVVAMAGDGVNDAPALVLSDVGISMGAMGTDVAFESSGVSLMSDELRMVPRLIESSRHTVRIIKQNIWIFAVAVNITGVLLSSLGFLTPIAAAVIHNVSSLFVVSNSARLLKYKY